MLPTPLTIKATKSDADSDGLGAQKITGFSCQTPHQGHWHTATQKTEAFAINAAKHARLRNGGEAAMQ
ncbi:hypothetical protein GCM10008110_29280 [Marinobacter persicus]|nr:hypothetical protein GCM10008110_29280 [Marinobacter persicus]